MKTMIVWFTTTIALLASPALAEDGAPTVPQFEVDAFWPKPLPNKWILGQVSGIATDRYDRIWVVHRPASLTLRERAAEQNPPEAKCCVAAPPVLVFDQSGNLLRHWGGAGEGFQWPQSEHGIFIDNNDFVWLAGNGKNDGQLLKFTMDGKFVLQIGKQGEGNDSNSTTRLGSPADVAVDVAAKEVFAPAGYPTRTAVVFDSETGHYKRHWAPTANRRATKRRRPTIPQSLHRSSSATRCIASASTRMASSTSATAATTAFRCSARMALSSPSTSTKRPRAARARSTISFSRPTRIKSLST